MTLSGNYTLTQLEYVMALKKHGHFGRAAHACAVTQPTLSMQIQKFEENLGVILFDRSKKPLMVTEVGEKIIEQIQQVLFEAKKIELLAEKKLSSEPQGELRLGVIPTVAPYILPKLLPVLESKYRGISLHIRELQTSRILEAIDSDEIDVGLLALPLKIPRLFEFALFYEPFFLLCHASHEFAKRKKIAPDELSKAMRGDIWLLEEGHCMRHQVLDLCSKRVNKARSAFEFESGSLETLKRLVSSYKGYTLMPALAADDLPAKTRSVEFERPVPAREVGLVYRREHFKSDLIEALGQSILESIPENLRKLRKRDLDVLPL